MRWRALTRQKRSKIRERMESIKRKKRRGGKRRKN